MNGLSICSGIGGLDLGLSLAVPDCRTVCYVEIEPYPQDILLARMADGVLDRAPIWGDLKQFDGRLWRGLVDIVHGGYPCQPFSVAGKRAGADDPRHLWPDIARIVRECEPEWCFFENVAGHLTLGFDVVARELEAMDYRVAAGLFTAAEVGAPHRRQRLFILAHSAERADERGIARSTEWRFPPPNGQGDGHDVAHRDDKYDNRSWDTGQGRRAESPDGHAAMGHADDPRLEGRGEPEREGPDEWPAWPPGPEERDRWARVDPRLYPAVADANRAGRAGTPVHLPLWQPHSSVPNVDGSGGGMAEAEAAPQSTLRGMADGLPHRVDRLKALGNAVVPAVAALAWRMLYAELAQ